MTLHNFNYDEAKSPYPTCSFSKPFLIASVFYGRDRQYFVCTHSASARDRHRDQAYYLPGAGDTVMT